MSPDQIRSIYAGIENRPGLKLDRQGWNSENPIVSKLINRVRPNVFVEVGVWKGCSILHAADICRGLGLPTKLYGIDAWFGHVGDMIGNPPPSPIPTPWTAPTLYQQFLFNVKAAGHDDRVIPVWQLARWGASCLSAWGVLADMVYIDAGHDEEVALADMRTYWPILRDGGVMYGDDYSPSYGIREAIARFSVEVNRGFTVDGAHWILEPK